MSKFSGLTDKVDNIYLTGEFRYVLKGLSANVAGQTFLKCDGSTVLQSEYANLYSVLGTFPDATTSIVQTSAGLSPLTSATVTFEASDIATDGTDFVFTSTGSSRISKTRNFANWSTETVGLGIFYAIKYANGLYVASGPVGSLQTSTNGTNWTSRTSQTISNILALTYGNNVYVYGGVSGALGSSTNAINWTARTSGTTSQINVLAYGTVYVYGTAGGGISTSTNGTNWTSRTSGTTSNINSLIYDNSLYVYGTAGGGLRSSTNAINWTARTSGTTSNIDELAYGASVYLAGGNNATPTAWLITSTNVVNWTSVASPPKHDLNRLLFNSNDSKFYAVGSEHISTSTNGLNWTTILNRVNASLNVNGTYVFAGGDGLLKSTTDFNNWTIADSKATSTIWSLTYGNGVYVYGGVGGTLGSSTDTINWTSRTSGTSSTIQALIYDNGLYLYGGDGGVLATSTNAINWTSRTSGTTSAIYGLAYGHNVYAFSTFDGSVSTSTNATNWTSKLAASSSGQTNSNLTFHDNTFFGITGGSYFYSQNGESWYKINASSVVGNLIASRGIFLFAPYLVRTTDLSTTYNLGDMTSIAFGSSLDTGKNFISFDNNSTYAASTNLATYNVNTHFILPSHTEPIDTFDLYIKT